MKFLISVLCRRSPIALLPLLLTACGGGDAAQPNSGSEVPSTFVQHGGPGLESPSLIFMEMEETASAATRDSRFSDDYVPLGPVGASWTFSVFSGAGRLEGGYTTSLDAIDGIGSLFKFMNRAGPYSQTFYFEDGAAASSHTYYLRDDGVYRFFNIRLRNKTLQWKPRLFAYPSYAAGVVRSASGSLPSGIDLNGDGVPDSARFDFSQTLIGYDDPGLPPGSAHFKNIYAYSVTLTENGNPGAAQGERIEEDIWLAPGLGPVRMLRGILTHQLTAAQVGASTYP